MDFINRTKELNTLNEEYEKNRFSFIVIYGRRRVGKTRLISEFIKNKDAFYFLADIQTEKLNIQRFCKSASRILKDEFMTKIDFNDWGTIFEYIFKHWNKNKKLIIVVDEFQYLAQINAATASIFQRIIDETLQNQNCMLILCGSIISLMYKHTLTYTSPLYGRRTAQIKLQPLSFVDFSDHYRNVSETKSVELYAILSGIPKYMELFEFENDIYDAIVKNIFNPNSYLYQEPRFLLNEELSTNTTYFSILQIIAEGTHKLGKISSKIGTKNKNITSFLDKLRDLEIIQREVPIFETSFEKSKKGLYVFKDNFLKFWFQFVFPNMNSLEMGNTNIVISRVKEAFSIFVSYAFERIAQEIIQKNSSFQIQKIGRYWDKNIEIDLVAIGEKDILFGECKWMNRQVGSKVLSELKEKVNSLNKDYIADKKISYALFSKKGFKADLIKNAEKESTCLYSFE